MTTAAAAADALPREGKALPYQTTMFRFFRKLRVWWAKRTVEKYVQTHSTRLRVCPEREIEGQRRLGVKSGIKTSEFWMAVVGSILAALGKARVLPIDLPNESILVLVGYILSRGLAKLKTQPQA